MIVNFYRLDMIELSLRITSLRKFISFNFIQLFFEFGITLELRGLMVLFPQNKHVYINKK